MENIAVSQYPLKYDWTEAAPPSVAPLPHMWLAYSTLGCDWHAPPVPRRRHATPVRRLRPAPVRRGESDTVVNRGRQCSAQATDGVATIGHDALTGGEDPRQHPAEISQVAGLGPRIHLVFRVC